MTPGRFIDFYLPYADEEGRTVSAADQAAAILAEADRLVADGAVGASIVYSANYGQTRALVRAYKQGEPTAAIGGANQAQVMSALERALTNTRAELAGRVRIAPITTMNGYGSDALEPWNDDVHMTVVAADLARIEGWLREGWCVLGWQNQHTVGNEASPYAVGGGVARVPPAVDDHIQASLKRLALEFPA